MSRTSYKHPKALLYYLMAPNQRHRARRICNDVITKETDIYTYDDLRFSIHPMRHLIPQLRSICEVFLVNGRRFTVVKVDDDEYPYEALAYNRQGEELFTEMLDTYDATTGIRFKTTEELDKFLYKVQKLPGLKMAAILDVKVAVVLNFLQTYDAIKRRKRK